MAEGKAKPVKEEEEEWDDDDDNVPIAASRARPVNKEEPKKEEEDEDDVPLALSRAKKRKPADPAKVKKEEANGEESHKGKVKKEGWKTNAKLSKPKKEEPEDSEEEDPKEERKRKKRKKEEEKKVSQKKSKGTLADGKEKKQKKVYVLPGQRHDPPEERDPLRIFYETLHEQVPRSEMAAMWMMEWGLLPPEEAKKVYETKLKKSQQQKLGSPVKLASVKKTSSVSVKKTVVKTSNKRRASDSEVDDDDFILSKKRSKKQKDTSRDQGEALPVDGDILIE